MSQQKTTRTCGWCDSVFASAKPNQKFCTHACKLKWASAHRWDNRPFKFAPCFICGTETRQYGGKALCPGECRKINHAALSKAWHDAQGPEYAARNYQRHKHMWRVWNGNRVYRIKAQGSVHTTESKIRARMDYFGHVCWVCGAAGVERDHVKPLSRGGAHMPCNIRPICVPCNRSKKDKWPYAPPALEGVICRS